jgi:MFS family permease
MTTITSSLAFEVIFPFVNQMIYELGIVNDPEKVGYYSGLIESLFSVTSLLAVMPCGYLSDKVGRKPVVLAGQVGLSISLAMFGLSQDFIMMVISRITGGALSGSWAAARTMTTEVTDKTNQGSAFALMSVSYRLGQTIGLPIGGLLAHPEKKYPIFQAPFWEKYPFALPCFVGSGFALTAFVLGLFLLDETLPSKKRVRDTQVSQSTSDYGTTSLETPTESDTEEAEPVKFTMLSVLTPNLVFLLLNTSFMCLLTEMAFAVYPLFAYTSVEAGGLGISDSEIGAQLGFRAFLHIAVLAFYPKLHDRLGSLRLYQSGMLLWPLVLVMFPTLSWLVRNGYDTTGWVFLSTLVFFFFIWSICGFTWTCMFSLITDSCPSQAALATVNSLSQVCIVVPQALAPASATSLFAWSLKSSIPHGNLTWIILFMIALLAGLHSLTLKISIPSWRDQRK